MYYLQHRLAKRDGEIIQQERTMEVITKKVSKWWQLWKHELATETIYGEWYDKPFVTLWTFKKGDRVQVKQTAGFHKGAVGEIDYIDPSGKVWVIRDGAKTPVYYHRDELDLIWRRPNETM